MARVDWGRGRNCGPGRAKTPSTVRRRPSTSCGPAWRRRDAGAGETGTGVEVVAGTRLAHGLLRVDVQGRLLVLHSAAGYRERGVGVSLGVGSANREGLSLSVAPRWGDAAAGGGTLWQEQVYHRHLPVAQGDARGEYGVRLRGGGLLTWFGALSQSAWGRRFSAGGRVDLGSRGETPRGAGSGEAPD